MLHDIVLPATGEFIIAVFCLVLALTLTVIGIKAYRQQLRRERRRAQSQHIRNLPKLFL